MANHSLARVKGFEKNEQKHFVRLNSLIHNYYRVLVIDDLYRFNVLYITMILISSVCI